MPLTRETFCRRALREARGGRSEEETGLFLDQALLLLPQAMDKLALEVAMDPQQRGSLRTRLAINAPSGYVDLTTRPYILVKGLPFSEAYDADTGEERVRLVWKDEPAALSQWLSPTFGYYAVRTNRIILRRAGSTRLDEMQNLILYTVYIPDLDTWPLPEELESRGLTIHAELLRANVAQK